MRNLSRGITYFAAGAAIGSLLTIARAQEKAQVISPPSSSCSRDNALEIIRQQIDLSKTIDIDVRRIAIVLRAADIIWPYQEERARATFADAFEVATRDYKAAGDKQKTEGRLVVDVPDQRYKVITAIARHDSIWARKLSKQILDDEAQEAADKATKDPAQTARTGEKLLVAATLLLDSDQTTALGFARSSFAYPATIELPGFLFKLSAVNRVAADQFYREALTAYSQAPMEQFLYLSSYPLAAPREIGEMPVTMFYKVPAALTPNPSLERAFVVTLLSRARELIENPAGAGSGTRFSEASQIFMALSRLEPLIETSVAELSGPLRELRENVNSLLTQPEQQRTGETLTDPPKRSFDEVIEGADRLVNADRREGIIAIAILNGAETESLDKIEAAATKIDDRSLRSKLLTRVYFSRAQRAIRENKIDEARKLAAKVDELDQRAYLYSQIVSASLKQTRNDTEAREMLEGVIDAVGKAPNTEIKARALLVVVHLYSTIDHNRAVAVLGYAVKAINGMEAVDLSGDYVHKRIEGKAFGAYTTLQTPGFSPETVFREIGKLDFDGTLYLTSNLSDKSLRAMTTLALADQCLKDLAAAPKPKPKKHASAKP